MANGVMLTRRNAMVVAVGGGACAAAVAAPSLSKGFADMAGSFEQMFRSPYSSLALGDHQNWEAQKGQTITTADGHALEIVDVTLFAPFGRRLPGVPRTRAFAVDFQLTSGTPMAVEQIHSVTQSGTQPMDLFLTGVGNKPGRVRAMFN